MKQILLTIALCAASVLPMLGGYSVPYTSDIYNGAHLDGWTATSVAPAWTHGENNKGQYEQELGVSGCATKQFDANKQSDAWLVSPAINVKAGKEYEVSLYVRTEARYGEKESLRVVVGKSSEVSSLKNDRVVVFDYPSYSNLESYEKLEGTYTATETGEVYFGVQCYSPKDQDRIFVTRFSVNCEEGVEDDPIDVSAKDLPYSYTFNDDSFKEWTSVAGENAANASAQWTRSGNNYALWEYSEGIQEDNWLISPALNIEKGGSFALITKAMVDGKLDVMLGTDKDDLDSFNVVKSYEGTYYVFSSDESDRTMIDISTPGEYYIAFRACAEEGTDMGYRIYEVGLFQTFVTPAVVSDLKAVEDPTDLLSVTISWTYPSETNTGAPLESISKAELYRGEDLIETFNAPAVGTPAVYTDSFVPEEGVYTYKLLVYGEDGYDLENDPATSTTGYVGKPVLNCPVDMKEADFDEKSAMFTVYDANSDGVTFEGKEEYGVFSFKTKNSNDVYMDDYVVTPYFHLTPGYYRVSMEVGGKDNRYCLGYSDNRHNLTEGFVEIGNIEDNKNGVTVTNTNVINIEKEGDYCFGVHHYGKKIGAESSYYCEVKFNGFAIEKIEILPGIATDLSARSAIDNSLSATITWRNPSLDNAGLPLTAITKAVVYRGEDVVGTVDSDIVPGDFSTYTDTEISSEGEYIYKVEIYNENGMSEEDAPQVMVFVGAGVDASDYSTNNFEDWKVESSGYSKWKMNDEGVFLFSNYWNTMTSHAMSPYFDLAAGNTYEINIETKGGGDVTAKLMNGSAQHVDVLKEIGEFTPHDTDDKVHSFTLSAVDPSTPNLMAADNSSTINVEAGKNVIALKAETSNGQIGVKSFAIAKKGVESGVQTVYAVAGMLKYADGRVIAAEACDLAVYTLDGRKIASAENATELELSGLADETVVVTAIKDGKKSTLKIIL